MKGSHKILLCGVAAAGSWGCSAVIGLDRFDGARLAISDDAAPDLDGSVDGSDTGVPNDGAADVRARPDGGSGDGAGGASPDAKAGPDSSRADATADAAVVDSTAPDADMNESATPDADMNDSAAADAGMSDSAAPDAVAIAPDASDAAACDALAGDSAACDAADAGPAVAFTFDTDTEGWTVDYTHLVDGGPQDCPVTYSSTEGSPAPGSLELRAPFSAGQEAVEVAVDLGAQGFDFRGRTLTMHIKLASGLGTDSAHLGYAIPFAKDVRYDWADNGGIPLSPSNGWVTLTMSLDHPKGTVTQGYSASEIRVVGVQFATWGGAGSPADIFIDTVTVR